MNSIQWLFVILIVTGMLCALIPLKEKMENNNKQCPTGCVTPTKLSGNCSSLKKNADGSYYKDCPYECKTHIEGGCTYDKDCITDCPTKKIEGLWDSKGNIKDVEHSISGEAALLTSTASAVGNSEMSEQECAAEARRKGLKVGGLGFPFAGDYDCNGCYTYRRGKYKGFAYFGRESSGGRTACSVNAVSIESPSDAKATAKFHNIGGNDVDDSTESGPSLVSEGEEEKTGFPSSNWDAPLDEISKGCKLPSHFGDGIMGIGKKACEKDSRLDPGQICDIGCEGKYQDNKAFRGKYSCSKESILKKHNLKCRQQSKPRRITAAIPQNDGVTVNVKIGKSKFTELISFFKEIISKESGRQPRRRAPPPPSRSGEVIPPGDRQRQNKQQANADKIHDDSSASQAMSGTHDGYRHKVKEASAWTHGKFPGKTGADANENPYDSIMSISPA